LFGENISPLFVRFIWISLNIGKGHLVEAVISVFRNEIIAATASETQKLVEIVADNMVVVFSSIARSRLNHWAIGKIAGANRQETVMDTVSGGFGECDGIDGCTIVMRTAA
jgi:hypothetical protein